MSAYVRDAADSIHGVVGTCACGSRLFTIDGRDLDS